MIKTKRYYCNPTCYHGVNGYTICDRKLKGDYSPIAFSTRYAKTICDILNANEKVKNKKHMQKHIKKITTKGKL